MIHAEIKVILSHKMLQGHCTNSSVTCLQPQQQLQLEQSCSVIAKDVLNSNIFMYRLNAMYDSEGLADADGAFPSHTVATKHALSPNIVSCMAGTSSVNVFNE